MVKAKPDAMLQQRNNAVGENRDFYNTWVVVTLSVWSFGRRCHDVISRVHSHLQIYMMLCIHVMQAIKRCLIGMWTDVIVYLKC